MSPGLAVSLNGEHLVTVAVDDLNILDVRVHGDVVSEEFATLDVTGSKHPNGAQSTFLIWIGDRVLQPGSEVEVSFLESTATSYAGKPIDEFYPEEEPPTGSWQPTDAMFDELGKRPRVRERFRFEVLPTSSHAITAVTAAEDHSFGFSVSWNSFHPERARISLSSTTLQSIRDRANGTSHAELRMSPNQRVKVRVDA
jgi:hypothetical protein